MLFSEARSTAMFLKVKGQTKGKFIFQVHLKSTVYSMVRARTLDNKIFILNISKLPTRTSSNYSGRQLILLLITAFFFFFFLSWPPAQKDMNCPPLTRLQNQQENIQSSRNCTRLMDPYYPWWFLGDRKNPWCFQSLHMSK